MTIVSGPIRQMSVGDVRRFGVDFTDDLSSTETLATATATQVGTTILTVGSAVVNSATTDIDDREVAIGKGTFFQVSGQTTAHSLYRINVQVTFGSAGVSNREVQFEVK